MEKAFLADVMCLERVSFARAEVEQPPLDNGFPLKRGVFTGMLAEHELARYAAGLGWSLDLDAVADEVLARMRLAPLGAERVRELRAIGLRYVRDWRARFPPTDD